MLEDESCLYASSVLLPFGEETVLRVLGYAGIRASLSPLANCLEFIKANHSRIS